MGRKSKKNQSEKPSQPLPAHQVPPSPVDRPKGKTYLWILLLATFAIFSPSLKCDFVNWDDDRNVYENPMVKNFDVKGIFTQNVIGNYNPLSILSFALEYKLFGMDPMVMHLNNILLHLLCVLFCALIFERLGLIFPFSMLGVALFAWHPLRVESVSWITERKDVLYGVFFLACLWLYVLNLEKPNTKRGIAIFVLFIIGLFAKIQMVTLPLAMLAVDYWKGRPLKMGLLREKLPHFAASLAFGLIGLLFLKDQGSLETNEAVHTGVSRIFIGSYSLMVYLVKWLVPYEMSPLYPYPQHLSVLHYLSLPAAIAVFAFVYFAFRRNWRATVFGFAFFFFNIAFLLQILGAGQGYLADRFTYIAFTGLFFSSAFGLQKFLEKSPNSRLPAIVAAGLYLAILATMSYRQTRIWTNSETLWTHVLKYYNNTPLPYNNRANHYRDKKQFDLALQDYNEAVRYKAGHATFNSRAKLFFQKNEDAKAIQDYDKAISMMPKAEYYVNRGAAKAKLGRPQEALEDINKGL
ncbi:MAG: glycosyltransferase family 39 protein [Saprospiraceae bacterium]|nr:glycosyltransferase family 39 protein [Saprospiraceae bacterium]